MLPWFKDTFLEGIMKSKYLPACLRVYPTPCPKVETHPSPDIIVHPSTRHLISQHHGNQTLGMYKTSSKHVQEKKEKKEPASK